MASIDWCTCFTGCIVCTFYVIVILVLSRTFEAVIWCRVTNSLRRILIIKTNTSPETDNGLLTSSPNASATYDQNLLAYWWMLGTPTCSLDVYPSVLIRATFLLKRRSSSPWTQASLWCQHAYMNVMDSWYSKRSWQTWTVVHIHVLAKIIFGY